MYGQINPPWWDKQPVAVVGGGPSLKGFDFDVLRGAHVLAVKGTIFDLPWADAGFGLDMPRFNDWREKLARLPARIYWAVPQEQLQAVAPPPENVIFLQRLDGQKLSDDPGVIYSGGTSGFGALQICLHKRARKIVLFGFDYDGNYNSSAFRHNDGHYTKRRAQSYNNWQAWATHFEVYRVHAEQHGIEIINACPSSSITCFPKVPLDIGIAMVRG